MEVEDGGGQLRTFSKGQGQIPIVEGGSLFTGLWNSGARYWASPKDLDEGDRQEEKAE
jgi:hypothetical protein